MKKNILLGLVVAFALGSCTTSKDNSSMAYFQNLKEQSGTLPETVASNYRIHLQDDDELVISISSSVPEATAMYNLPLANTAYRANTSAQASPKMQTYVVRNGHIELPVLGSIAVKGKTTDEVASEIKGMVARNVKDPSVHIELVNFTVNVMGEVKAPQRLWASKERLSVLDALAACGDLTEYGKRDNVLVIRTENGKSVYHRINLTDGSVYASPCFYLQQNDVVYVEPNAIKADNSKYNQYTAFKLSQLSTIVSVGSIIASLIIALTVK